MKGVLVALVLGAAPAMAAEPSDAQRTAEATMPLPIHLRAGAKVMMTNTDGSERVLRQGTNGFECTPDDPAPGFAVGCFESSVREFFGVAMPLMAKASSPAEGHDLLDKAIEEGLLTPLVPGMRGYVLSGPDRERAKLTLAIFLPGATVESTGLSTKRSDATWLMCPGTAGAHIMVGDITYGQDEDFWKTCGR